MPSKTNTQSIQHIAEVEVAIAVICHRQQFLLGYRHAKQHQGERYEFVGGKIMKNESPLTALIREVNEEIGLQIDATDEVIKLGEITHTYEDMKQGELHATRVLLHVFNVELDTKKYAKYQTMRVGREGQPVCWVDKDALLANDYALPAANLQILHWLANR